MSVTERVKREIWAESAGLCAICRRVLIDESLGPDRTSLVGEVAHMVAEQTNGPRGASDLTTEQRNEAANLLLLCLEHHKLVDDHPDQYPVALLQGTKRSHREWVRARLSQGVSWSFHCQHIFYLNVPRLEMLSRYLGKPIDQTQYASLATLRDLGGDIIRFLPYFEQFLGELHPSAVSLTNLSCDDTSIGALCSFSQRFRTKNVGTALEPEWKGMRGDLKKDPHVYCAHQEYKLILPIDPRWLTTNTAGAYLSSGQGLFSGLCLINDVNPEGRTIYATPLLIGQPENPQLAGLR